jgi:hypothetical protein
MSTVFVAALAAAGLANKITAVLRTTLRRNMDLRSIGFARP